MRIERIELRRYHYPLDPPFVAAWDPAPRDHVEATLAVVHTDVGLLGVGSGDTMDGFERFEPLFIGRDPLDLERHAGVLETLAFHAGRYWPLEAALWDLAGKAHNHPACELLGGEPDGFLAYASCGGAHGPSASAEAALRAQDEGFRAVKLRIDRASVEKGLAAVRAAREAIDNGMALMVDLNEGWRMPGDVSPPLASETVRRVADELADLDVVWLEEPLPNGDARGLAALRASTRIRIAGGEMARTVAQLEDYRDRGALDVYQPDAVLAVGMKRGVEVAERVRADGLWFAPHTWTNGIGLLANLHVAAAVGTVPYIEFPYDPPGWTPERRDFMLSHPIRLGAGGKLEVPRRPGLGVELDEERLEHYRVG